MTTQLQLCVRCLEDLCANFDEGGGGGIEIEVGMGIGIGIRIGRPAELIVVVHRFLRASLLYVNFQFRPRAAAAYLPSTEMQPPPPMSPLVRSASAHSSKWLPAGETTGR